MITISKPNGDVVTYLELPDVADILRRVVARQVREITVEAMNTNRPEALKSALTELFKTLTGIRFYTITTRVVMERIWNDIRSNTNTVDFYVNITNEFYAHYMTTMGVMPIASGKSAPSNQLDALIKLLAGSVIAAFPPSGTGEQAVISDPEFHENHMTLEDWEAAFRANLWFMTMYLMRVAGITPDDVVMFVYPQLGQNTSKGK